MKMYLGFNWVSRQRRTNTYPYCFLSSAVCWSYSNGKKLPVWRINNAEEIILDSGGFSLLNKYGDYPYSIKEYVEWIKKTNEANDGKVILAATRDYPCEPEIARKIGLMSNLDRIKRTVEQTKKCMKHDISPARWMPVLQGYSCQEYLTCYQMFYDAEILMDYIAIGSMCKRNDVSEIQKIIKRIKHGYSGKIHLFGLARNAINDKFLFDVVDSCDTIAYTWGCKDDAETVSKKNELINHFDNMSNRHKKQNTLDVGGSSK